MPWPASCPVTFSASAGAPGRSATFSVTGCALLARAAECSPFHAERLRGIDPRRFELADLPRLPVMTKAQMMADFDRATTDRRLTRELVELHLAGSRAEPSLLLGEYVCLLSGGSSGLRGLVVQRVGEYADGRGQRGRIPARQRRGPVR